MESALRTSSVSTFLAVHAHNYIIHLTARGDIDGGTWLARPRFRRAVAALCEDSGLYALVNGLADVTSADEARSRTRVVGNVDDPGDDRREGD